MANTANLNIPKPTVGADDDTWGTTLNNGFDSFDAPFKADGTGTSVGLKVGTGKTLNALDGTVVLGDAGLTLKDTADPTKIAAFQCSGITAGNTRTLTVPDASGTVPVITARFHAQRSASVSNFQGNSSQNLVICDTVNENLGSAYSGSTGLFTAPSAGYLQVNGSVSINDPGAAFQNLWGYVIGSTVGAVGGFPTCATRSGYGNQVYEVGPKIKLASGETVGLYDRSTIGAGTKTGTLYGGASTYFSGTFYPA